jgi:hypothetical protein
VRLPAACREAWRNVVSGTSRTLSFGAALATIVILVMLVDLRTIHEITLRADAFRLSGASVVTVVAPGRISGTACERLNSLRGIRAAGAVRDRETKLVMSVLPQSPVPLREATPSFASILTHSTTATAGLVVSDELANALGVKVGDPLRSVGETSRVAGIYAYPDDGRAPGYGYLALQPVSPEGNFDECWADVWPQQSTLKSILLTTIAPGSDVHSAEPPRVEQLNSTLGATFDGESQFRNRATRFAGLMAAVGGLMLGFLSVRTRRMQLSSALHSRVSRRLLNLMLVMEGSAWVLPVVIAAFGLSMIAVSTSAASDQPALLVIAARVIAWAAGDAYLGIGFGAALTREKHLFRYFKDR